MSCDVGKAREGLELILQVFSHFTYVTAHSDSPSFLSLHLHHSSFSNPFLALPMSHLILQPFYSFTYITAHYLSLRRFNYVTAHSTTLLSLQLCHRHFTYVTWRSALAALYKNDKYPSSDHNICLYQLNVICNALQFKIINTQNRRVQQQRLCHFSVQVLNIWYIIMSVCVCVCVCGVCAIGILWVFNLNYIYQS